MRTLAVSAVLAGSMAVGLATAPAQASSTVVAKSFTYGSPNKEGYFKGRVYKQGGHYYFKGFLWDGKPKPQDYTYVRFRYYDELGDKRQETHKVVSGKKHFGPFRITKDFDLRVCDAGKLGKDCGSGHDVL